RRADAGHDEVGITRVQPFEDGAEEDRVGIEEQVIAPLRAEDDLQLAPWPAEDAARRLEQLRVERLLDLRRRKIALRVILEQIEIDVRVPVTDAGDAGAEQKQIAPETGDDHGVYGELLRYNRHLVRAG